MQTQVTFTGTVAEMEEVLVKVRGNLLTPSADVPDDEPAEEAPAPKRRGRGPGKKTAPVEVAIDEDGEPAESQGDDLDLGDEPEVKAEPKYTIEQIRKGFQAYAAKHSRDKAAKILTKYGVKSIHDIPEAKYPEVLKLLKV